MISAVSLIPLQLFQWVINAAEIISEVSLTPLERFHHFNLQRGNGFHENITALKRQKTGRIFKKCDRIFTKLVEFYHKFGRKTLL
jgi:hypothetical protein